MAIAPVVEDSVGEPSLLQLLGLPAHPGFQGISLFEPRPDPDRNVYTIVQTSDYGLTSMRTIALGSVAVALLGAFVVRQATARNPILPAQKFWLPAAEGVWAFACGMQPLAGRCTSLESLARSGPWLSLRTGKS